METVVEDQKLRAFGQRRLCTGRPLARDPGRRLPRQQQRLVADDHGIVQIRVDPQRTDRRTTVAPGQDVDLEIVPGERTDQGQDHGCLAGPADDQVADADHRDRQHPRPGRRPAQAPGKIEDRPERTEQAGQQTSRGSLCARRPGPEVRCLDFRRPNLRRPHDGSSPIRMQWRARSLGPLRLLAWKREAARARSGFCHNVGRPRR